MVLESTVVCIDNSEWMRNGDLRPTRLDAQRDAVNLVCGTKLHSNPENTVALMTLANREVLVTLTTDMGKILTNLHSVRAKGKIDFLAGLQVAGLVLKHRQSKNHRQRIVVFVGSPIEDDEKELVKLGKKLKKNNVSVDVISFGEDEANRTKLEAFIEAVNKDNTSHVVSVPAGVGSLSDSLVSSPILEGEAGAAGLASGEGLEFGVDPNLDPELALALRVSMEEERARQQRAAQQQETPAAGGANPQAMQVDAPDADLQAAAARSLEGLSHADMLQEQDDPSGGFAGMSEEEQMALALKMSMEGADAQPMEDVASTPADASGTAAAASAPATAAGEDVVNSDYLAGLLMTLPGVDPNDPEIQATLAALQGQKKDDDKSKK